MSRTRRVIAGIVLLAASGGAVVAGLGLGGGPGAKAASELPPAFADVRRQTLSDSKSVDGELAFWPSATAVSRLTGTLTSLPKSGRRISRGQVLYAVDDKPVLLMYGSLPAYRTLGTGAEGTDVRQLERNLSALGYTGFTVDDTYSTATAAAVRRWQDDLGEEKTGTVELGRVMFGSGPLKVDSLAAQKGDPVAMGGKVLTYTSTGQAVAVELDPADQQLARKNAKVTVELPDGKTVGGRVSEVSSVIKPAEGDTDAKTIIKVIVSLTGKAAGYTRASVHVEFTTGTRKNILAVPVAALVVLSEGGFGVEVVKGQASTYVPVTTGLFAGGQVEISGTGITEGTRVGMPK